MLHDADMLVTTFSVLVMLGNHYCVSLLKEVQAAIEESNWQCADERLKVFVAQAESCMSAEIDLLYPRLFAAASVDRPRLKRLERQQQQILCRQQRLVDRVSAMCAEPSCGELTALIRAMAAHRRTAQPLLDNLPQSEALLKAFAERLHQSYPKASGADRLLSIHSRGCYTLPEQTNRFDF